ncbi:MAG: thiamine-binding protein [Chloroflexota bacterium]|nr:thiamine-binding protein [Chloroflexota bacterium]
MIVEIQVIPKPSGTKDNEYAFVDAAIAVLKDSGLHHEVGALGTTFEGDPDAAWRVIRKMVEDTLSAGADSTLAHIKVAYIARDMNSLTNKFR